PKAAGTDAIETTAQRALAAYATALDAYDLSEGAAQLITFASAMNQFVQERAPWELAKRNAAAELDAVLATTVRAVARLAVLALPFMPERAVAIWDALGTGRGVADVRFADLERLDPAGWTVQKPPPLFPKPAADR